MRYTGFFENKIAPLIYVITMKIFKPARTFLMKRIDAAVDANRPLSWLVKFWVCRDPALENYEKAVRLIDIKLREGAESLRGESFILAAKTSRVRNLYRSRISAAVAAAVILLSVCVGLFDTYFAPNETINGNIAYIDTGLSGPVGNESDAQTEFSKTRQLIRNSFEKDIAPFAKELLLKEMFSKELAVVPKPVTFNLIKSEKSETKQSGILESEARNEVLQLISDSNPLCSYFVTCYVRPALK
ncbi:MAG: hypothetical protein ACRC2T_20935 [Thermoguttaceae bacterium]